MYRNSERLKRIAESTVRSFIRESEGFGLDMREKAADLYEQAIETLGARTVCDELAGKIDDRQLCIYLRDMLAYRTGNDETEDDYYEE